MSENKYFEKKAGEILGKLLSKNRNAEDMEKVIYLGLKEACRDQRYACVEACQAGFKNLDLYSDKITGLIQNAMIGDK